MSGDKKVMFFVGDKPIDLNEATSLTDEPMVMPQEDGNDFKNPIELSFDCVVPKEKVEWIRQQAEELEAKEKEILGRYRYVARLNARYYLPILQSLASDEAKEELLEDIILKAMCKGWNDCFDINVKHEKK